MCHSSVRRLRPMGAWSVAVAVGLLALTAAPARAYPKEMPMVFPVKSLPAVLVLNPGTNFNLVCLSQVALDNRGSVMQTAVVNVAQQNQQLNPEAPFPLFLPAHEVPLVQQLNQGTNLNVVRVSQVALGSAGRVDQVALVNVQQVNEAVATVDPQDLLFVCPTAMLPVMHQLNTATNFNVVRVSQFAVGNVGPVQQTALVSAQQQNGFANPAQGFPLHVPAQYIPQMRALNIGLNVNVVNIFQVAIGNTGDVTQVALVNVTQNQPVLNDLNHQIQQQIDDLFGGQGNVGGDRGRRGDDDEDEDDDGNRGRGGGDDDDGNRGRGGGDEEDDDD